MDGIFWMPFYAYFTKYGNSSINYTKPTYYHNSKKKENVKSCLIKIKANSFSDGNIIITQYDHRHNGIAYNIPYPRLTLEGFISKK